MSSPVQSAWLRYLKLCLSHAGGSQHFLIGVGTWDWQSLCHFLYTKAVGMATCQSMRAPSSVPFIFPQKKILEKIHNNFTTLPLAYDAAFPSGLREIW